MTRNNRIFRGKTKTQTKYKSLVGRRIFLIILLFILCGIFVFSTYTLARRYKDNSYQAAIFQTIQEKVVDEKIQDPSVDFNYIDIDKLIAINKDVVGFIQIPDTTISFPILQSTDNSYYLDKDITKKYNINGSIFMDFKNNADFSDDNVVIFGHNMHNGNMFNPLLKVVDGSLGNKIYINICTREYNMKYVVYASYYNEPTIDPIRTTLKNKKAFINETLEKSLVEFDHPKLNSDSHILTLSTCNMTGKKRTIVHAVRAIRVKRDH